MNVIKSEDDRRLADAAALIRRSSKTVALTGAGISVGSGIPDFRSPGGLWSVFAPDEYATLEVFQRDPEKAWELYRALGKTLLGKVHNPAHRALAQLEERHLLAGVVTQNVDNLHQQAGSRAVLEIHGDHQHLQCLQCSHIEAVLDEHYQKGAIPHCPDCSAPLKPNVVLFGEPVRQMDAIERLTAGCELLLVIGTSAQVYPAAGLPLAVKHQGGVIFEFNREQALGRDQFSGASMITDYFFEGDVERTLPMLLSEVFPGEGS
ncbi:MAG: NAD-dependent deacylase [Desulfofustis sp.]